MHTKIKLIHMKNLIIFFGGAGSGKTTIARDFAEKYSYPLCDGDDYKKAIYTIEEKEKLTHEQKRQIKLDMYASLIIAIKKLFESLDTVCITDTLLKKEFQQIFINEFGSNNVLFVFINPNEKLHLQSILERELKDPNNKNRDKTELKNLLQKHYIERTKREIEFPEKYSEIKNNYDNKSVQDAIRKITDILNEFQYQSK